MGANKISKIQCALKKKEKEESQYHSYILQIYWTWARGYKTFFMLNSAENEICSVYKKLNTNNLNLFPAKQS